MLDPRLLSKEYLTHWSQSTTNLKDPWCLEKGTILSLSYIHKLLFFQCSQSVCGQSEVADSYNVDQGGIVSTEPGRRAQTLVGETPEDNSNWDDPDSHLMVSRWLKEPQAQCQPFKGQSTQHYYLRSPYMCVSLALLYDATLIYKCSPPNLKGGIHLTTAYQFFSHQQSSLLALKNFFFC